MSEHESKLPEETDSLEKPIVPYWSIVKRWRKIRHPLESQPGDNEQEDQLKEGE